MENFQSEIKTIISKVFSDAVKEVGRAFPTKEHCFDEIYRLLAPGLTCRKCGGNRFTHVLGSRDAKCDMCGKKFSVTADSPLFHRVRKPIVSLTALILAKNGVIFNPHMLHTECKVAYQSAYTIFEKISGQANEIMEENATPVISSELDEVIFRRSCASEPYKHPVTEGEKELAKMSTPDGEFVQSSIREFFGTDKNADSIEEPIFYADEQAIYDLLAARPLSASEIADMSTIEVSKIMSSLMVLECCGLIFSTPDGRFKCAPVAQKALTDQTVIDRIGHATEVLKIVFQGVSRRYIQRYVGAYWCFVGRTKEDREKLVRRCCWPHGLAKTLANDYVSPVVLSFPTMFRKEENTYAHYGLDALCAT